MHQSKNRPLWVISDSSKRDDGVPRVRAQAGALIAIVGSDGDHPFDLGLSILFGGGIGKN